MLNSTYTYDLVVHDVRDVDAVTAAVNRCTLFGSSRFITDRLNGTVRTTIAPDDMSQTLVSFEHSVYLYFMKETSRETTIEITRPTPVLNIKPSLLDPQARTMWRGVYIFILCYIMFGLAYREYMRVTNPGWNLRDANKILLNDMAKNRYTRTR